MFLFVRANAPRPTFHLDMTAAERATMERHVAYWTEHAERGAVVVFGPVLDPARVHGMAVCRVDDLAHAQRLIAADPALGLLTHDVFEMPRAVVGRPVSPAVPADAAAPKEDFRCASGARWQPRAAVDAAAGLILAGADVHGTPEQVFRALTTDEVERWWRLPGVYRQKDWKAEVRAGGRWSVTVALTEGGEVHAWGEFCELDAPGKIVMTRRFDAHPFLGERETTITYRLDPSPHGTRVTVRDEGFIGRPEAAYGNAEIWEKVLGWLDGYLGRTRR